MLLQQLDHLSLSTQVKQITVVCMSTSGLKTLITNFPVSWFNKRGFGYNKDYGSVE
jgi:hypothetical protein